MSVAADDVGGQQHAIRVEARTQAGDEGLEFLHVVEELVDDQHVDAIQREWAVAVEHGDREPVAKPRDFASASAVRMSAALQSMHAMRASRPSSRNLPSSDIRANRRPTRCWRSRRALAPRHLPRLGQVHLLGRHHADAFRQRPHVPARPVVEDFRQRVALVLGHDPERHLLGERTQPARQRRRKHRGLAAPSHCLA